MNLAEEIYRRVDFRWMLQEKTSILCHGWTPERGFILSFWDEYSEAGLLYLLGIGSPTFPITPESWYAWKRNPNFYGDYRFVGTAPLFTVQYSHAFVDFHGQKDGKGSGIDWFQNSAVATRAHRQFCIDLAGRFPGYAGDIWGITSFTQCGGYNGLGRPASGSRIDGIVRCRRLLAVPMFTPICLPALRAMHARFGKEDLPSVWLYRLLQSHNGLGFARCDRAQSWHHAARGRKSAFRATLEMVHGQSGATPSVRTGGVSKIRLRSTSA